MTAKKQPACRLAAFVLMGWSLAMASPAAAQPTAAQQDAIRSNCRSDFLSNCSGVPRGGAEALQCLQRNVAKLSAGCQAAVNAVTPRAATPAPAAAPAAPPAPATAAPPPPAPSQAAAPPASTSTPPATAPQSRQPPPPPARATTPPPPARAAAPPASAPPAANTRSAPPATANTPPPPAATAPMPQLPPRVRLAIVRTCDGDVRAVCSQVPPGDGRIIDCLARNEPALTPACKKALADARKR